MTGKVNRVLSESIFQESSVRFLRISGEISGLVRNISRLFARFVTFSIPNSSGFATDVGVSVGGWWEMVFLLFLAM